MNLRYAIYQTLLGIILTSSAFGAELEGSVSLGDVSAEELKRVVVYLTGFQQPPPPLRPIVIFKERGFVPSQIAVTKGQTVHFANLENESHNPFGNTSRIDVDLGEMGPGDRRAVVFSKTGHINLFCNVHSEESLSVLILPNRAFATPGPDGKFRIKNIPRGIFKVIAWHPTADPFQRVVAFGQQTENISIQLRVDRRTSIHWNKHGRPYGSQKAP